VRHGRGVFWAVQYHPEYELLDVAQLGVLRAPQLIEQGFFAGPDHARSFLRELEELHTHPSRRDLAYRLAAGGDILDPCLRTREVRNWLDHLAREPG
jgi:GMP synthase (glutamine-hydrolysing)